MRQEFEVVKKLEEAGYSAVLRLSEQGYFLKVKKTLRLNGKPEDSQQSSAIEAKVFSIAQKFGYHMKEIGAEEYDKGVPRPVPYIFFIKEYPFE